MVVVAAADFAPPSAPEDDFASFLLAGPDFDVLDLGRSGSPARDTDVLE